MKTTKFIGASLLLIALVSTLALFNSCRKTVYNSNGNSTTWDNTKTTQGTIFGQIVAEDGTPISGVVVKVGGNSYTTNNDGVFHFSKITTPQNATLITATKSNYMTGYRTLRISTNKDHYTRIMMIELKTPTTFNSISGGMVNVNGGGTITFPTDAIVYKNNGTPYSGTVNVYAKWLDPTGDNLNQLMPGDLRAINTNNIEQILASYGMMGVELQDNSGAALQIAPNKTAKLSFPIPASLAPNAPNTIPLWFFDVNTGMWKQEGSATKQGNNYVGDVKHFSFWNCDVPNNYINLDMTIVDNSSTPLLNLIVKVTNTTSGVWTYGWTNTAGYVSGAVPDNATLLVEVIMSPCNTLVYSQTITTTSSPLSLGTIVITPPTLNTANITGTVLDCSGNPVSNGYISINSPNGISMVATNSTGSFNTTIVACTLPIPVTITAYDMTAAVSGTSTANLIAGANNLGSLTACGTQFEFVNWTSTVGTTTTSFSINEPFGFFIATYTPTNGTQIEAYDSSGTTGMRYIGITFNGLDNITGTHNIVTYLDHLENGPCTPTSTIPVTLTNYGIVGDYIIGSFTGSVSGFMFPSRTINCSFKIKR